MKKGKIQKGKEAKELRTEEDNQDKETKNAKSEGGYLQESTEVGPAEERNFVPAKPKPYKLRSEEEFIKDFTVLDPQAVYSYADYLRWSFTERVELIKGKLTNMAPAPLRIHQEVSVNLLQPFSKYLRGKRCRVYHAPFDVRLSSPGSKNDEQVFTVVQPDLCVICNPAILDDKGCNGAPDLVIEIISPSTEKIDKNNKRMLYQENGVREYWIVNPAKRKVMVYILGKNGIYNYPLKYISGMSVPVSVLGKLNIKVDDIFME